MIREWSTTAPPTGVALSTVYPRLTTHDCGRMSGSGPGDGMKRVHGQGALAGMAKQRVLILGAAGFTNLGDDAILAAMLADLRDALPDAALRVTLGDPG